MGFLGEDLVLVDVTQGPVPVEGLSPREALRLYLETAKVPPERANLLLSYGALSVRPGVWA